MGKKQQPKNTSAGKVKAAAAVETGPKGISKVSVASLTLYRTPVRTMFAARTVPVPTQHTHTFAPRRKQRRH